MRRRTVGAILGATALVATAGIYVAADAADAVPGIFTRTAHPTPAAPPALTPQSAPLLPTPTTPEVKPVTSGAVEGLWAPVMQAAAEGKYQSWGIVVDAETGDVLLDSGATAPRTPASITKIVTAFTALTHLDPSARLNTGTSLAGSDLYLWGEGDLLLAANEGNENAVNGRAGLKDLATSTAARLKEAGVASVTLHGAPQPFEGDAHLPAWQGQEVTEYEGRVAAMAIASGRLDPTVAEGFQPDPAGVATQTFAQHLRDQGVNVEVGSPAAAPTEGAQQLGRVESATVAQQVRYFLATSDNTMADQYCRLAARAAGAPTSYQGSAGLVKKTLSDAGISVEGMSLEDCSGLSTGNRLSGQTLVQTMQVSLSSDNAALGDLMRSLPWGGWQGTLKNRLNEGSVKANVQAKTGSLASVSTLAGVVTTSGGQTLIFVVGNDGIPENGWATRGAIDTFIQGLADA
ncbi:MAG: D-alanyl-D-alanine carboxypeptidase/D-alanyl-D-alanine-endopeptidase [Actinomycetaceae bacterium]|nr:D-alanyl-D-alanine carboxypeptidase/D-alanyl-D-alanine-endopeptidase [Actinomycetaceae bacterium]